MGVSIVSIYVLVYAALALGLCHFMTRSEKIISEIEESRKRNDLSAERAADLVAFFVFFWPLAFGAYFLFGRKR